VPRHSADEQSVQRLYELAARPEDTATTKTAHWDMFGGGLTKADVCDALRDWIDAGKDIRQTQMRGQDAGQPGYEIKPTLSGSLLYCKFVIRNRDGVDELLIIVSAHPDH